MCLSDCTLEDLFPDLSFSSNVLFSGGASGADTYFGCAATKAEFQVIHWCFKNDSGSCKVHVPSHLLPLTTHHVKQAAERLHKNMPTRPNVLALIQRNAFQVCFADAVYAVGWFQQQSSTDSLLKIEGGTGWSCQMYVDRFQSENQSKCKLYFFDQVEAAWFVWDVYSSRWKRMCDPPPAPTGRVAGIGSRKLTDAGKQAITNLFSYNNNRKRKNMNVCHLKNKKTCVQ